MLKIKNANFKNVTNVKKIVTLFEIQYKYTI